jgi:O-antigen ligase
VGCDVNHPLDTARQHGRRTTAAVALTAGALVWTLIALAGIYPLTLVPVALALTIATLLVGWRMASSTRVLDVALIAAVALVLLQAVPLPLSVRDVVTPHASAVDRALLLAPRRGSLAPLSLDPRATWQALFDAALMLVMFFVARTLCAVGGVRGFLRTIAWTGLVVASAAIVLRPSLPGGLLSLIEPTDTRMYGPFVNRNHMGTWLLMALPLVVGYIAARIDSRRQKSIPTAAIDGVMVWLAASAVVMLIATVASLSRSAMVGAVAAAASFTALAQPRRAGRGRPIAVVAIVLGLAIVFTNSQTGDLMARFEDSKTTATWSRAEIWRQTLPIVRDFPIVGVGAGAYPRAMLQYQQSSRALFFNQAHNQFLQLAAEGGLTMLLIVGIAGVALVRRVFERVKADGSPMFWIRIGAASGIAGVLVQSLWETGLRMPANGLLFAVLCAIASFTDRRVRTSPRPPRPPGGGTQSAAALG